MRPRYFVLAADGHTPRALPDVVEWARWFETANRIVAQTEVTPDVKVSTVFLGINHNFGSGSPILFETMIFGGPHDSFTERYHTWDEAEAGHARAVARARKGKN